MTNVITVKYLVNLTERFFLEYYVFEIALCNLSLQCGKSGL